jgi:phosphoribosylanthranilate isomerase
MYRNVIKIILNTKNVLKSVYICHIFSNNGVIMKVRIKICCIKSVEEAKTAVSCGASALGLVGKMPSGPGPIEDEVILKIARYTPPPIATFLLTSETEGSAIISHHKRTQTNTIQIVDAVRKEAYKEIRKELPGIKLVQVIHVIDEKSVDEAVEMADYADAVLLDSGNPNLAVKELGGTGRVHNWALSRKIVDLIKAPVFLAGGLNSGNVKEAVDTVQPFGVDVCSGVRTNGNLDELKLEMFIKAIE